MKNAGIACVVACAAMVWTGVRAEENPLLVDGVLEVKVDGSQEGFTADQLAALKDPACVEVKKTGAGELILKGATGISSFKGKITIAAGTYTIDYQPSKSANSPLGTGDGPTEVQSGATLSFAQPASGAFGNEEITIAGTGANGMGALCRVGTVNGATSVKFKKLTLADDALVVANASGAASSRNVTLSAKLFDMNGKTLRYEARTSDSEAYIEADEIVNDGHIYLKTTKGWHIPGNCPMTGGPNHVLTIDAQAVPSYSAIHTNFCNWTLRFVNSDSGIRAYTPPFQWDGPLELPESGTVQFYASDNSSQSDPALKWIRFNGPISGGANIRNGGDMFAYLILGGTNDNYTGKLTFGNNCKSTTVLMVPEALPKDYDIISGFTYTYNRINDNGIGLGVRSPTNPGGWTFGAITNAWEKFFAANKSGNVSIYTPGGETSVIDADFDSSFNYYWRDNHNLLSGGSGEGETIIRGSYDNPQFFRVYNYNNLVLTAKDKMAADRISSVTVNSGHLTLRDMGTCKLTTIYCGVSSADCRAETVIEGDSVISGNAISIGARSATIGACGQLRIRNGAVVSNSVTIAGNKNNSYSHGALIMEGGTFVGTGEIIVGASSNSTGSVEMKGGSLSTTKSSVFLARHNLNACGVWHQTGGDVAIGTVNQDRYLSFGCGTSTVYVAGGTFDVANAGYLAMSGGAEDYEFGRADLTVAGGTVSFGGQLGLADRSFSEAVVNLNGGVLEAATVVKRSTGYNSSLPVEGSYASVSFNGGTLRAGADGDLIGAGENAPDAVCVRAEGATIDTAGHAVTLAVPLAKVPTAGGIQSLALAEASKVYWTRPEIVIIGDGHGATAIADFNETTHKLTGITVTNPGWGYTAAKTSAVVFLHTDTDAKNVVVQALTVTIGDNAASGGLVKTGEGVLTLTAANTYEGATEIREGGLRFAGDAAVPSADKLLLTGGYLMTENVGDFPAELHVNLGELDDAKRYVIASFDGERPATMPTVYVNGSTTYPAGYCLWYRGKDLVFGYRRGAVLLVR